MVTEKEIIKFWEEKGFRKTTRKEYNITQQNNRALSIIPSGNNNFKKWLYFVKDVDTQTKDNNKTDLCEYAVLDPANVCGIFPFKKRDTGEQTTIETNMGTFKKLENPKISFVNRNLKYTIDPKDCDAVIINGTKFSQDYIKSIRNIANVWFDKDDFSIYMLWDKKKKRFKKNCPALFLFDVNLCFILAPRIEGGGEIE